MTYVRHIIVPVFAVLLLNACENTKKQLGMERSAPDEFAVVKRAPLELPPDYTLRPPRPGAQRPQEATTDAQARQTVFGTTNPEQQTQQGSQVSVGEAILLDKTGAGQINPNIREVIDRETDALAEEEKPTIDRIIGLTGKKIEPPARVVDPVAETERIKKSAEEGKPVTDGETAVFGE